VKVQQVRRMPRISLARSCTDAEDALLLQLRGEGKSFALIAARLRRSSKAAESRHRLLRARMKRASA
jgi:hypothetical protein